MDLPKHSQSLYGKRFGALVAEEPIAVKHKAGVIWRCRCDCGNYENVLATKLTQNADPITMCKQCRKIASSKKRKAKHSPGNGFQDLTGQRFGMLTVIERAEDQIGPSGRHRVRWLCQCDCGSAPKSILAGHLKSGKITSCGCTKSERISKSNIKPPPEIFEQDGYMFFSIGEHNILFDPEDQDVILAGHWALDSHGYCCRRESTSENPIRLHRKIMGKYYDSNVLSQMCVDHINGNKDDYRKANLRLATHAENMRNMKQSTRGRTLHKGVHRAKSGKWCAKITYDGHVHNLGTFADYDEACMVREEAERRFFGEFSRLNAHPSPVPSL